MKKWILMKIWIMFIKMKMKKVNTLYFKEGKLRNLREQKIELKLISYSMLDSL
jgi:hypothetical protein